MDPMTEMVDDSTLMQLLNLTGYNLIRYQSDGRRLRDRVEGAHPAERERGRDGHEP